MGKIVVSKLLWGLRLYGEFPLYKQPHRGGLPVRTCLYLLNIQHPMNSHHLGCAKKALYVSAKVSLIPP